MALTKCSPADQLALLKGGFVVLCVIDVVHWCALINNEYLPNVWSFYSSWDNAETLYLAVRLTADLLVGLVGVGVALCVRCWLLALPCLLVQSGFIISRTIVWIRRGPLPFTPSAWDLFHKTVIITTVVITVAGSALIGPRDIFYICAEFAMPFAWCVCVLATIKVLHTLRHFEYLYELEQPPVIVLTVDDKVSDPSAQMES